VSDATQILLVEDDTAIRESLSECLELEGLGVRAFADGAAALAWLTSGGRAQVAVVDLVMPRLSGEDFLRALRGDPALRALPVVLMTAASGGKDGLPAADVLLSKPFELADFLAAVRRYVR
jgi:CheY-like chemotaxis protein